MANQEEYVDLSSVSVEKYVTNTQAVSRCYVFAKSEAKDKALNDSAVPFIGTTICCIFGIYYHLILELFVCIFYFAKKSENPFNFVKFF